MFTNYKQQTEQVKLITCKKIPDKTQKCKAVTYRLQTTDFNRGMYNTAPSLIIVERASGGLLTLQSLERDCGRSGEGRRQQ